MRAFFDVIYDGQANLFTTPTGSWTVTGGRYRANPASGGDAISTVGLNPPPVPSLQVHATVNAGLASSGRFSNGFVIFDYANRYPEGVAQLAKWLNTGELRSYEQIEHGDVGDFPETLLKLFRGENTGKLILALNK